MKKLNPPADLRICISATNLLAPAVVLLHIFNILDDPERFAPGVIRKTVDWFERTLGR